MFIFFILKFFDLSPVVPNSQVMGADSDACYHYAKLLNMLTSFKDRGGGDLPNNSSFNSQHTSPGNEINLFFWEMPPPL